MPYPPPDSWRPWIARAQAIEAIGRAFWNTVLPGSPYIYLIAAAFLPWLRDPLFIGAFGSSVLALVYTRVGRKDAK